MSNRRPLIIVSIVFVLLIGLFAIISQGKQWSWRETYDSNKKDPYGTFILAQLLENYFPNEIFSIEKDSIAQRLSSAKGNYFFLGSNMFMTEETSDSLLNFVARGNQAFLISHYIPTSLTSAIFDTTCYYYYSNESEYYYDWDGYYYYQDTIIDVNFTHPNLKEDTNFVFQHLLRKSKVDNHFWYYMHQNSFCETGDSIPTTLGILADTLINFVRVGYGEGMFLLHTNPSLFTNLHLLKEDGRTYAAKALSHLAEAPILWDAQSKIPNRRSASNNPFGNRGLSEENPLQYILSQPPLAWAWYILLGLGLLYLIFRAKRRQRMIPVLERNENTSLAFVSTIGRMYFLQNNHKNLALQKMQLFLADIRDRYKISTQKLDENFTKKLAIRSEVDQAIIDKIVLMHQNIQSSQGASENTLIEFHQQMERFWKAA